MSRKTTGMQSIVNSKNSIRGALGNKNIAQLYQVISSVVEESPAEDIPNLASWIDFIPPSRHARIYPLAKVRKYSDLSPAIHPVVENVPKLIRWTSEYLTRQIPALKKFIEFLEVYEHSFLRGDYEKALNTLQAIENELGLSIWLIESRIAILHRYKGIEAQKEYARSIHIELPNSIPAYIAHYVSQRNEDSISFERFALKIRSEIEKQPLSDEFKLFIQNRLTGKTDTLLNDKAICASLSVSFVHSIIDAYEGLIDTLQAVLQRPKQDYLLSTIRRCLMQLRIPDWRLSKLRAMVCCDYATLSFRDLGADDALLRGDFESAIQQALAQAIRTPTDIDALSIAASGYMHLDREPEPNSLSAPQNEIMTLLKSVRMKRGSVEKAASDLYKLVQNNRGIRPMGAVWGYVASEWLEKPQLGLSESTSIFYSTTTLNPQHWIVLSRPMAESLLTHSSESMSESLAAKISNAQMINSPPLSGMNIPSDIKTALEMWSSLYHEDIDKSLIYAQLLVNSPQDTYRRIAAKVELNCLLAKQEFDQAIRRVVAYCCEFSDLRHVLPLRAILAGKRWKDVKHLRSEIVLPIIFDIYCLTIDAPEHETNRRIAYDEFLKANRCQRPSELVTVVDKFEKNQLVYFLWSVCVPDVMDVSFDVFTTSREIQEERIRICSLLTELDPVHRADYAEEITIMTKYLTIQDGLRDVDRSRVHVNTEAVARWAEKEITESFLRYKELLKAKVGFGSPDDFDMAMRKAAEGDKSSAEKLIRYPVQEGDSLLIEMFEAIQSEALTNSDYGLDAYLSMRIRHGSLSGYMRGPLEERNLIVSKDATEKYQDNKVLADLLGMKAGQEQSHLFDSFRDFSAKYDSIIEDLTKNRLQIKRKEKPMGMFSLSLELNPLTIHYIRSRIQEETTFTDFLFLVFTGIQLLLKPVLLSVRDYIISSVKRDVEGAFEVLRSSLEKGTTPSRYAHLNSVIADAIPSVQAAIDRVAEWFVPVQKTEEAAVRTVEQIVEIGIEATRTAHRGFSPKIERQIEAIDLQLGLLSEFTDILFTVLDNVYCHSGNKASPWVKLRIWSETIDADTQKLKIKVESEVSPGAYSDAAARKLDRIRQQMASGEYRKLVNLEGGTGLLKLKRIVSLDERQNLEFGFIEKGAFFVHIDLILKERSA